VFKSIFIQSLFYCLLSAFLCSTSIATAATKAQAVKAGVIYNISKFVVWPSQSQRNEKFNVCIFGKDNFGGSLEALYGKSVGDWHLVLRRYVQDGSLTDCRVAFVAEKKQKNIQLILNKLKKLPVLTVSDSPNFIDQGGMVGLIRDGNRVGFEFNVKAVRAAGLNVGAQLLKLAKRVKGLK